MKEYLPIITGFLGAIIGAAASVVTIYLQNSAQNKRDRIKLASELAIEDFKLALKMAETSGKPHTVLPIAVYVHFHTKLLEALDAGELDEEKIHELTESNKKVIKAVKKANEEYDI